MRTFIRWRSPSVRVFDQTDDLADILPGVDYIVNFTVPIDFDLTDLGVRPIEAVTIVSGYSGTAGATGAVTLGEDRWGDTRFSQKTMRTCHQFSFPWIASFFIHFTVIVTILPYMLGTI